MSKENNGGPAFPYEYDRSDNVGGTYREVESGLTIRDYFAAKCMSAVIGSLNGPVTGEEYPGDFEHYASTAYKMADAMLKARE
jgi:hypothetical protein